MKKTITIFLLTALCMTVLTSCDIAGGLGNGLVSELLEHLVEGYERVDPPLDVDPDYNLVMTDVEIVTDILIEETWVEETWPVETWPVDTEWDTVYDSIVETEIETEIPTEDIMIDPPMLYPSDYLTLDGDLSDWNGTFCTPYYFDEYSLDPWVGYVEDKGFTVHTTADPEFVYFAFDVYDPDLLYSDDGLYNGDAFQIQIDLNGWCAETEYFERAIFYSFGLQEDETVDITVQCIYGDTASYVAYVMASDDQDEWREGYVKGVTKKKNDGSGWVAELAISWQTLYNDVSNKLLDYGCDVPVLDLENQEVYMNMLICYLDHAVETDGSDGGITGAWGTPKVHGSLSWGDGWYPEGAGVRVTYQPMYGLGQIEYSFEE